MSAPVHMPSTWGPAQDTKFAHTLDYWAGKAMTREELLRLLQWAHAAGVMDECHRQFVKKHASLEGVGL